MTVQIAISPAASTFRPFTALARLTAHSRYAGLIRLGPIGVVVLFSRSTSTAGPVASAFVVSLMYRRGAMMTANGAAGESFVLWP